MSQQPVGAPLVARFAVDAARRAAARSARRGVILFSAGLIALAILAWVLFPPGPTTRVSLTAAASILGVIAVLLIMRVVTMARKADRLLSPTGEMLELSPDGFTVAGELHIPLAAISGVWAVDRGPELRVRAERSVTGAPGRVMLRAGANTADITIGVLDATQVSDPAGRLRRFRPLPSGNTPARIEIPFGSQFGTRELHEVLAVSRALLPTHVPVRLTTGALDYASAWAGTADAPATIAQREAGLAPGFSL